jgi:hypothetical protein
LEDLGIDGRGFYDAVSREHYIAFNWRMINGKGFGRKHWSPNRSAIPTFAWSDEGTPRKAQVITASFPAEIRTEYVPNMSVERYHYVIPLAEDNIEVDLEAKWRDSGLDVSGSGWGLARGFCIHGNESSGQ